MEDSLHKAVYMNNLEAINKLITEQNVDVNETDRLGRTPLQIAAYFGFYQAAKHILENGGIVDEKCYYWSQNGFDDHTQHKIIQLLKTWEKNKN